MFRYADFPIPVGKVNVIIDNFPQNINFWAKEQMNAPVLITERGKRIDFIEIPDANETNIAEVFELDGVQVMRFTSISKFPKYHPIHAKR